jgi:hypothetical protein
VEKLSTTGQPSGNIAFHVIEWSVVSGVARTITQEYVESTSKRRSGSRSASNRLENAICGATATTAANAVSRLNSDRREIMPQL